MDNLSKRIYPLHLYTKKGEAFAKTVIFWVSMMFGLHTIASDAKPEIIGGGFLMYSLAMIMEFVFSAMDRKFFSNVLPILLVALNSYIVVVSATYFTTAPLKTHFSYLMDAVYASLIIITLDTIVLCTFTSDSVDEANEEDE